MAVLPKERMAKKSIPSPEADKPNESGRKRSRWIQIAIVLSTFAAIIILSIITQGPDNKFPPPDVIAIRIALLVVTSALYFFMLYHTHSNGEEKKSKPEKK